jgi:hypothetical protein
VLFGKQNILNVFYKNECACDQPYQCDYLNACSSGKLCGYIKNKYLFPELDTEDEKPARPVNIKKPKLSGATTKQIIAPPIKKARKL